MSKTQTNTITRDILEFLLKQGVFAWRENTAPIPLSDGKGYRSGGISGKPDIMGVINGGRLIGIEIKIGKDKLRPAQIAFHAQVKQLGAIILVTGSLEDFKKQWNEINK